MVLFLQLLQVTYCISLGNTNRGNFELFAAVGGVKGSGVPLAYCFIQTSADADRGAKEVVLKRFCDQLKRRGVDPEYTLSDKDWAEINAMRAVWPNAKHQLCFWHALRAIKKRLCNSSERPGDYDYLEAQKEFAFVSSIFVPLAKQDLLNKVCIQHGCW